MKKIIAILSFILVAFTACEGPQGAPGFDGRDGLNGQDGADGLVGAVFDQVVNFGAVDNYTTSFNYPTTIEVFENDAVLVYRLAEIVKDDNNIDTDVWQLIPQNFFLDQGILQYNYDHTFFDIELFLDGNFDLSLLGDEFTQEQIFRIVILPATMAQAGKLNTKNYQDIEGMLDINPDHLLR